MSPVARMPSPVPSVGDDSSSDEEALVQPKRKSVTKVDGGAISSGDSNSDDGEDSEETTDVL